MPFAPILALTAPLGGLLALLVAAYIPPLRPYRRYGVPLGAGLSLLGVLFTPLEDPRPFAISLWQPLSLLGTFPTLLADRTVWPLALAWAGAVTGGALAQMGRPQPLRPAVGGAVLAMLTFGLAALWGENLLTVLLAWAGFDLAWAVGMAAGDLPPGRAAWAMGSGSAATLLLWMGALALEGSGSGLAWPLVTPAGWGSVLLLVAALIRLGLYPFHLVVPAEMSPGRPIAAALLLEPVLAWGVLARMSAQAGLGMPARAGLEVLAGATFLIGGFLAWTARGPGRRVVWAGMASAGAVLWAGLQAENGVAAWVGGGAVWTLGLALLHLSQKSAAPGRWPGGLAVLVAPLVSGGIRPTPIAPVLPVVLFGQALLTAAVLKRVQEPAGEEEPVGRLPALAGVAGIAVAALSLALAWGAAPKISPPAWGWAGWLIGGGLGGGLFLTGARGIWRPPRALLAVGDALRPEWAGRLLVRSLGRATALMDAIADVAEGPGAVLWALATFLLILVIVTRR